MSSGAQHMGRPVWTHRVAWLLLPLFAAAAMWLGVVALLGLGTVAILLAALPGIASAHPTGLFVIWVIAVLVLMGVGAAGAWQVRGGSGRPGR